MLQTGKQIHYPLSIGTNHNPLGVKSSDSFYLKRDPKRPDEDTQFNFYVWTQNQIRGVDCDEVDTFLILGNADIWCVEQTENGCFWIY